MDSISDHIHVTGDISVTLAESREKERKKNQTSQFWLCGRNFIRSAAVSLIIHTETFLKAETNQCNEHISMGVRIRCWNKVSVLIFFVVFWCLFGFVLLKEAHDTPDIYRSMTQTTLQHIQLHLEILGASKVLQADRGSLKKKNPCVCCKETLVEHQLNGTLLYYIETQSHLKDCLLL